MATDQPSTRTEFDEPTTETDDEPTNETDEPPTETDEPPTETDDERASDAGGEEETARRTGGESESDDDPYEIRLYEPDDRDGYLDLYDLVLGDRDEEWFRWKYEDNPYADHVPIVLATTEEGKVVGAKPCFALELRAGDRLLTGFQPADVAVHPDHRRRGLYSRTTERMKEHYREHEPDLFFNFPNPATLSGSLKHGWQVVEEVPTFHRVQRPDALLDGDSGRLSTVAAAARPLAGAYLRARDALATVPDDVTVERSSEVPAETFVELYERSIPRTIHANRSETFYEWRFGNPRWTYDAYVARRDGEPIAGVVVGTQRRDGSTVAYLTDVVPLADAPGRVDGLRAVLERVLADGSDVDLFSASGRSIPRRLLAEFGFHSDLELPLSPVARPTTQVTYPIADDGGHEWTVAGRAVADPSNWTVTFAEQDTS